MKSIKSLVNKGVTVMRRGFGFLWVTLTGILLAVVGVIAYQAGWSEGAATHVSDGVAAAAPYYYYGPHFDGFGSLGSCSSCSCCSCCSASRGSAAAGDMAAGAKAGTAVTVTEAASRPRSMSGCRSGINVRTASLRPRHLQTRRPSDLKGTKRHRGRCALGAVPIPTMEAVPTILVVEDEPQIVRLVRDYLEHGGFTVLVASDGPTALRTARTGRPDLVILDLGLPKLDGLDVTRALRRDGEVPIIMLTARTEESDKLVGLELGADDYMTKPFSPKELVARVRAVLRRAEGMRRPADVIRVGSDVELDVPRMDVRIGGRRAELTKTEFQILATMARQPGRIFTRAQLLDAVKGVAFESYERAIDAHIKNIRRKIEPQPGRPRYVLTVFGVGYRFAEPTDR